jgi:imidazolonepropionase-like amidohydrolase
LGITGGHLDISSGLIPGLLELGPRAGIADGVDEVIKAVRHQIKNGAKWIKCAATAGILSLEGPVGAQQYSDVELRAIVNEAARHGIKVAAHAHGTKGILAAVKAGVASIEHGSMLNAEAINLMKEKGTFLVPTSYVPESLDLDALPPIMALKAREITPQMKESHRRAVKADVKIAFGADAGVFPHGQNAKEFAALIAVGMKPIEAIRSATIYAADLLDIEDRATLKPGKLADIIAVSGNPLVDVTVLENVAFVMKAGRVYKRPN